MGVAIRRASTLNFNRPSTPGSRSSSESLRHDSQTSLLPPSMSDDHKLPSPVPESPAREAREVADANLEVHGPSPLAAPPVTSEPIDIPRPATTEPDARIWDSSSHPAISQTPDQLSAHEVEVAKPSAGSSQVPTVADSGSARPSSESHALSQPQSEAPAPAPATEVDAAPSEQRRQIADPSQAPPKAKVESQKVPSVHEEPTTIQSPSVERESIQRAAPIQLEPPVQQVPAPVQHAPSNRDPSILHNPWSGSDGGRETVQAAPASAPPTHVDMPPPAAVVYHDPITADNSSAVGHHRWSDSHAVVDCIFDGPAHLPSTQWSHFSEAEQVLTVTQPEPEWTTTGIKRAGEDPFADPPFHPSPIQVHSPADNSKVTMPEPSIVEPPSATMPIPGAMPLPPAEDVIMARPIRSTPSNYSDTGNGNGPVPAEPVPYDTDETRPLLHRPSTSTLEDTSKNAEPEPQPVAIYFRDGDNSIWPAPSSSFAVLGWREHILPNGSLYFFNSSLRVTTDVDLRISNKLEAVTTFLGKRDGMENLIPPPEGWEMWLRDGSASKTEFAPARAWVDHITKVVSFKQPSVRSGDSGIPTEDLLEAEARYWTFIESHPAHAPLPPTAVAEAMDILTWSYTDRLLPSSSSSTTPFTQEECQELTNLLRSLDGSANHSPTPSVIRTRIVAKILLRITAWRQGYPGGHPNGSTRANDNPDRRIPFRRKVTDVLVSILCLGIPYLFLERAHHQRMDTESGLRSTAGPMLVIGACACLIAAVILSASVTFISLPGLDDFARIAGFVAILFSASSMFSGVIALFRYKADIERTSYPVTEGMILLSRRSVLLSLPLVFLIWSIAAFVTAVTLYAFRGLSIAAIGARHFEDYTQWAVVGTVGGLAGMLITSVILVRW
ncbi:hypothetical protein EWM64_g3967 [Hericium alpestre]|uniref:WW domain-containing protein n=1 Tax=Hericium alpestre TaxID=135208 RepID=A0A4Y9ZYS0_9AGAM|nr:hypothetical protein EWM64_g3967 [Hericium alpestre]